jgi:hypothetical protein
MPTILRDRGVSVQIYASQREHPPAHVHVRIGGAEAILWLGAAGSLPWVRKNKSMTDSELRMSLKVVCDYADYLRKRWREYHGA